MKKLIGYMGIVFGVLLMQLVVPAPALACKSNEVPGPLEYNDKGELVSKCIAKCAAGEQYVSVAPEGNNHCIEIGSGENPQDTIIFSWLILIIKFLSAGVGIAVTGGIVAGALVYMTGRDNEKQIQRAITIIINSIIGLVLYILMFALLNFLIPGGILS